ncbi:MAG: YCF48-related protein [Desulfuromonadaceae bacterium]|nr:YCF48-related protein [Desulfuromonadaceae bacterium]
MMNRNANSFVCIVLLSLLLPLSVYAQQPVDSSGFKQRQALVFPGALKATMLGATQAGQRIVAVGKHGVVLLSDDQGKSFRQAKAVPTRATLNSVCFVGDKEGWAVGHLGVVLHTVDGGEIWTMQRDDLDSDRPLFTVWFKDSKLGFTGGLWGLLLKTTNGGNSWEEVKLPIPPDRKKADKNLFALFSNKNGDLFIAAERGTVLKSKDDGQTWKEIATGSPGTLWTGVALNSGALVVAGLRGRILRSEDGGEHWTQLNSGTKSSITGITETTDGRLLAVGLDGVSLQSADDCSTFSLSSRPDHAALTAVVLSSKGVPVVFSEKGPVNASN